MDFNIDIVKRKMLVKYPFFGSVVANVNYKENTKISTAGTDGKTIYYNPDFLQKLNKDEQTFIFAHEVCHIAFDHMKRSKGKDPKIWNIATDAVINQLLKRDGLKLIDGSIDMAEAINYDAEELYDKLFKEEKKREEQAQEQSFQDESPSQNTNQLSKQNSSSFESNTSKKQTNDVGHDTHSLWEDAIKKRNEVEPKNESQTAQETKKQEILEQETEKISRMGEQSAFDKNLKEKRKELEALKEDLAKQAIGAGTTTNRDQRIINDIGKSKPIIDWRYILREAIQYDMDWSYKNANIEDGVVSANLEEQPMPETEIVLDTSGSINEVLLKNFLRECKNILQYSKVKVGCFDTVFYGFHEIRSEEDIDNMKFEGGGGTNFNVAVESFTKRVENKIIFTDGIAKMPDTPMNVIWIVFGSIKINPKGGKVIHITQDQLDKLRSPNQSLSRKKTWQ